MAIVTMYTTGLYSNITSILDQFLCWYIIILVSENGMCKVWSSSGPRQQEV
jgi:hypothetical protein